MPVTYQTTVDTEASMVGSSLHTGDKVSLKILPAPADTGVVFRRTDLPDQPTMSAHVSHVNEVERATTLSDGAFKIHTVEHLLSACRGMEIDNAFVELDAGEPPIGDGSGQVYVELLQKAGSKQLETPRRYFEIKEPVHVTGDDGAYMVALPYDGFKVSCTNANHTGFHTQYLSVEIEPVTYPTQIAPARTFVFYEEIQPLMEKGLIKGGSLENAIVIQGETLNSKGPMRFDDEFVRHKILDIVGDLTLFPLPIKAHIIAAKPSHKLNVQMARAIEKVYKQYLKTLMPVEYIPVGEGALDVNEVMRILPHRYPFLMVDRVLGFEGENRCRGCKNITINEPFFQGHFPKMPVMPGVLQLEAMAQVASILLLRKADNAGRIGFFMSADKVKFRKPVLPGDTLIIDVEMVKSRGKIGKAEGRCLVNDEVVSEGELTFAIQ